MSCEGGCGRSRPSDPKVVKLEVGSMRRKVGAGISGAGEVLLYVGESLAVGTGRWVSGRGSPVAATCHYLHVAGR